MRRNLFFILTIGVMGALFFVACKDNNMDTSTANFTATLNGASEVPANGSTATGAAAITFNKTTKILTMNLTYTGVTVIAAHIHKGAVGVSGNVIFPITGTLTSPISLTTVALTAEQESDLNAGLYYVNLHSAAFPDGEIRGQIMAH